MDFSDGDEPSKKRSRSEEDELGDDDDEHDMNEHQTSKSRGTVTVQIFIKKSYKMINDCDTRIASWTPEGDKFVIKDPERFANEVIPQYFDHNKFSSFTRQLNFYKFTREQSKVIKKSDHSSEVAKHQTFHHKFFHREHPELLRHLQRSRKGHGNDDDGAAGGTHQKKVKMTASARGMLNSNPVLEQVSDLVRRATDSEVTIKNLQQENSTLSFAIQKLQQQDEMKQRALVALEEHVRVIEVHMTQAFQQQQAQIQQGSQPLPFARESSLSAVNPSTLMRYLSMNGGFNPGLNSSLQRLATPPPFGGLVGSAGLAGLGGGDLAGSSLSQMQQSNDSSAAMVGNGSSGLDGMDSTVGLGGASGDQPTLGRNIKMKQYEGGGPTLGRHPRMKGSSTAAAVAAVIGGGGSDNDSGGAAPTLGRHPNMKSSVTGSAPGDPAPGGGGGAATLGGRQGFMEGNGVSKADTLAALGVRQNNRSPVPPSINLNGFGGTSNFGAALGNFPNITSANVFNAGGGLRTSSISPVPRLGNFANLNGSTAQQQQVLAAQNGLLTRELSNMAGGVSREESFGIASLMDLARGPEGI